jgi:hypothetical protein
LRTEGGSFGSATELGENSGVWQQQTIASGRFRSSRKRVMQPTVPSRKAFLLVDDSRITYACAINAHQARKALDVDHCRGGTVASQQFSFCRIAYLAENRLELRATGSRTTARSFEEQISGLEIESLHLQLS